MEFGANPLFAGNSSRLFKDESMLLRTNELPDDYRIVAMLDNSGFAGDEVV